MAKSAPSGHYAYGAVIEILVAKTAMSYTYTQPVREGQRYNLYHGTVEAVPVSTTTSKLVYTLVFDNSMLADDAARERDIQQRTAQFTRALNNMKTLAFRNPDRYGPTARHATRQHARPPGRFGKARIIRGNR